jgi:hypothetical protein
MGLLPYNTIIFTQYLYTIHFVESFVRLSIFPWLTTAPRSFFARKTSLHLHLNVRIQNHSWIHVVLLQRCFNTHNRTDRSENRSPPPPRIYEDMLACLVSLYFLLSVSTLLHTCACMLPYSHDTLGCLSDDLK